MAFPLTPTDGQVYRDGKGRKYRYSNSMSTWLKEYDGVFVGAIVASASNLLPEGYLWADGSSVSKTTYPDLYTLTGDRFGTTSANNFVLPDTRGRTIVGLDSYAISVIPAGMRGNSAANVIPNTTVVTAIGAQFGSFRTMTNDHVLTINQIPPHSHQITKLPNPNGPAGDYGNGTMDDNHVTRSTELTGGGEAHNHGFVSTLQPSIMLPYVIKY